MNADTAAYVVRQIADHIRDLRNEETDASQAIDRIILELDLVGLAEEFLPESHEEDDGRRASSVDPNVQFTLS